MSLALSLSRAWAYRGFILSSVRRELRSRYSGSLLGISWAVIQPFSLIVLYSVVFSNIMRPLLADHDAPIAYTVYLCAGLLSWNLHSELLSRCVGIFVHNGNLLKKVSFPKLTLPAIAILVALFNFAIIMLIFQGLLLVIGYFPGWVALAALPVIAILVTFSVGLGLLGATINVFYRDVEHLLAMVLQFWFWFTPIVYTLRILPDWVADLLVFNPMVPIVVAMQDIFLDARQPHWPSLLYPLGLAVLFLGLGLLAYRRLGDDIVDEL
ncbi:lipopolysaccharide transport system permease protein [Ectothiorhodospira mobilis]|uniref:Transport permease protein n=1 Tax=Ectothiorhodospira mobilis TaxID=195064 RepID=A0A1I4SJ40_ECTMO|nr:ABC transporter permease [Ectothiorhodospira mobilis]SFM64371.1 lipopolysaccharide transport system permease protein [Ectothiorhodospira mobilis]